MLMLLSKNLDKIKFLVLSGNINKRVLCSHKLRPSVRSTCFRSKLQIYSIVIATKEGILEMRAVDAKHHNVAALLLQP